MKQRGFSDTNYSAILVVALVIGSIAIILYGGRTEAQKQKKLDFTQAVIAWTEEVGIHTGFNAEVVKSCGCPKLREYEVRLVGAENYSPPPPDRGQAETFFAYGAPNSRTLAAGEQVFLHVSPAKGKTKRITIIDPR